MKKSNKLEVKDEEFTLHIATSEEQKNIDIINAPSSLKTNARHSMSLVVNQKLILEFEELLNKFKSKTKAYFTYSSKIQLFETGCLFLKEQMQSKGNYEEAPKDFIKYISRKGKRPTSPEHQERKGNSKSMFLTISEDSFDIYYNLVYSFLNEKKDIANQYYSTSYFFKDFLDMLNKDFKGLCKYEKDNPRE
jgi:hypothetical protein